MRGEVVLRGVPLFDNGLLGKWNRKYEGRIGGDHGEKMKEEGKEGHEGHE